METRKQNTNTSEWHHLLLLLPQAVVIGLITFHAGNGLAASWSPWLAYPVAVVIGVLIAFVGTMLFGDCPTTLVEMGCGGVITCVMVAILIPVFAQARQKAIAQRHRAEIKAEASPVPSATSSPGTSVNSSGKQDAP